MVKGQFLYFLSLAVFLTTYIASTGKYNNFADCVHIEQFSAEDQAPTELYSTIKPSTT